MFLAWTSFYRMYLYVSVNGLTRLRLLVIVFLAFEFIGLLLTLHYIIKKKFNIIVCYLIVMLCFYSFINLMPTDYIIAKNQVDRALAGNANGLDYVTQYLSADAYSQVERIKEKNPKEFNNYIYGLTCQATDENRFSGASWQSFNITWHKVIPKLQK